VAEGQHERLKRIALLPIGGGDSSVINRFLRECETQAFTLCRWEKRMWTAIDFRELKARSESFKRENGRESKRNTVPQTSPSDTQILMLAGRAAHARTFFLNDFVSVENKESKIQLPKLKVASSSLVARSNLLNSPLTHFLDCWRIREWSLQK
jgi:hypothetical protein